MRNKLEYIQVIDKYLRGVLNKEDTAIFEKRLTTDSQLREEVVKQELLMEGIKRNALKASAQKGKKKFKKLKTLKTVAISSVVVAIIALAVYTFSKTETKPVVQEAAQTSLGIESLENQGFLINTQQDTVIETENGSVFAIPADAFETEDENLNMERFESFLVQPKEFFINPRRDTILRINDCGTKLRIRKDSYQNRKGELVDAVVKIEIKEYNNSADIVYSQIPMEYSNSYGNYNFNSSGMISIEGFSNGEKVDVKKGKTMKLDFCLSKQNENIDFYKLKDDSSDWEFIQEIKEIVLEKTEITIEIKTRIPVAIVDNEQQIFVDVEMDEEAKNKFIGIDNLEGDTNEIAQDGKSTLLAGNMGAGHTYPDIVKGLNIGSFGVYNCDQIYRIKNKVNLVVTFLDEKGIKIEDGKVLSLIDRDYNAAFSFHPQAYTCNYKADNVLLLFTKSGKLFMLKKGEFKKLGIKESGKVTIALTEVTNEFKSTNDLKSYLGL